MPGSHAQVAFANLLGNSMVVTVSVRVEENMVPVIGVSLKRVDGGAIAQE